MEGHEHESSKEKIEELAKDIVHEAREILDDAVEIVEILLYGDKTYNQPVAPLVVVLV
jgi:hypothetical protein